MGDGIKKSILPFQKNEITEFFIYTKLASFEKNPANKEILSSIASDERRHYDVLKKYTREDVSPDTFMIWKYLFISRIIGLTFGLKLMERGEEQAQKAYAKIASTVHEAAKIIQDEDAHERELLVMIQEERLQYIGSVVLGLNDALIELTGALAGLTFALANTRLVATAGAITGIAASLSMAASEFISTKSEGGDKSPIKACVYTGIAYVLTVTILVSPYLLFSNLLVSLAVMLANAVIIIFAFTFYVSVAQGLNFRKRFMEMIAVSFGVAALSFLIGLAVRAFLKIEI